MLDSRLQPGASSGEEYLDDSSEQGCFVLEGELTVWLGDADPVTLYANDSFQLQPHARFRYANLTDKPTRVKSGEQDGKKVRIAVKSGTVIPAAKFNKSPAAGESSAG